MRPLSVALVTVELRVIRTWRAPVVPPEGTVQRRPRVTRPRSASFNSKTPAETLVNPVSVLPSVSKPIVGSGIAEKEPPISAISTVNLTVTSRGLPESLKATRPAGKTRSMLISFGSGDVVSVAEGSFAGSVLSSLGNSGCNDVSWSTSSRKMVRSGSSSQPWWITYLDESIRSSIGVSPMRTSSIARGP